MPGEFSGLTTLPPFNPANEQRRIIEDPIRDNPLNDENIFLADAIFNDGGLFSRHFARLHLES